MNTEQLILIRNISLITILFCFIIVLVVNLLRIFPSFDDFICNSKIGITLTIIIFIVTILAAIPGIEAKIRLDYNDKALYDKRQEECLEYHEEYSKTENFCPNCGDNLNE